MAEYGKAHVEARSIDWIPYELRHGSPRSLFTLWFGSNMQVIGVVTGALGVVFGLPLPWAIVGVIVGNLIGTVFMALHSAQGPKLGVPQMIQSRAQFGFYGAIIPLVLVILMYIGFYASGAVLGGQALYDMAKIPTNVSIIAIAIGCTLLCIFGYRFIHGFAKWVSLITAIAFAYLTIRDSGKRPRCISLASERFYRCSIYSHHNRSRHLSDYLCSVCRRLLALLAEEHINLSLLLVDVQRRVYWYDVDDDIRCYCSGRCS